jgi:L-lysine 2,3-aminomutase
MAWQQAFAQAVTDPHRLLDMLDIHDTTLRQAVDAQNPFRMRVPLSYIRRMQRQNPDDPLLRQVLPLQDEKNNVIGYHNDPVGDLQARPLAGVLHKYHGRALLIATGACAVHCRYCFRRHFPYGDNALTPEQWQNALDYFRNHTDIEEIIFSGGDPLSLPDHRLSAWVQDLERIPHVRRLRIHTRLPVVLPERVDPCLLDWLARTNLKKVIVLHINHAQELDHVLTSAIARLAAVGVTLLNQAVLLRGVNDHADAQIELAQRLFDAGVLPYYVHVLDKVAGAAHFDTADALAHELQQAMHASLPGYLVPRFVRELPGDPGKHWVVAECKER